MLAELNLRAEDIFDWERGRERERRGWRRASELLLSLLRLLLLLLTIRLSAYLPR